MKRVLFDIILFISIFISPWWVNFLLLLGGIFLFENFYEFIIGSFLIYSLYFIETNNIFSPVVYFITTVVILFILKILKNNIILQKNDFSPKK